MRAHADRFAQLARETLAQQRTTEGQALLTVTFDAELFGHWWFEGIDWLGRVLLGSARGEHHRPGHCELTLRREELAHPLDEWRRKERVARAVVDREPARVMHADVGKSRLVDLSAEDTLRQRAGYSAGPGVGIGHDLSRQLLVEHDVGDRDAAATPQHAERFLQCSRLSW